MAKIISQLPSGGTLPKHNDLQGLNEDNYIHLTQLEKANLDNQSGINTGDETVTSIQAKRPLKTIDNKSLEGIGNIEIDYNTVINKPTTFPPSAHTHTVSQITDFPTFKTIENQSIVGAGNIDLNKSDVGLSNVDNTSDANKPVSTATQTALNLKVSLTEKGAANGVATLGSDGKVPNSQIPALAISETFPVGSQAAMLGLSSAEQGDVAIRTDIRKSFILTQSPASTLANWQELLTPTDAVQSVNGQAGNVNLTKSDVGLSNVDNTSDINKPISTATQTALNLKENTANKQNSLATDGTGTKYPTVDAVNAGLGTKQNVLTNPVTGTFVAGRVPYSSSNSTLTNSSKLLWDNTNSYFEVNGNAPRFTLKNNLNNFSTYFTNNANGTLILKNHQDKTLAVFSNPVNSTSQPQMAIGNVSSIPVESQLYVYGGMNGANIDARGSVTTDEANIDLEGADWETNPNSIGLSYFGSNATSFGTVLGYAKNKLGVIRFQDTNYAIINSEKSGGISPIRFGINQIEIGNVNDKGFSYQSDFSSVNSSNPRWLTDKAYVDTKVPLSEKGAINGVATLGSDGKIPNSQIPALTTANITDSAGKRYQTDNQKTFNDATSSIQTQINGKENSFAKNTAFNKNFGTTAGTVVEGGTLGTNAYSSIAYLPLSGGNVSGSVGIGTTTPNRKLEVADIDSQFSLKGTITGAPVYQTWYNSSNVRRGYFGFPSNSNGALRLVNEESGDIYITPINGSTIVSSTITASPAVSLNQVVIKSQLDAKADLASPTFTGTPTAPTAAPGTNTTQIATTAFVQANKNKLVGYTVATLPAGTIGDMAYVTDASGFSYNTVVVGGGSGVTIVFFDGTNWRVH